jgi:hypothetical protein
MRPDTTINDSDRDAGTSVSFSARKEVSKAVGARQIDRLQRDGRSIVEHELGLKKPPISGERRVYV